MNTQEMLTCYLKVEVHDLKGMLNVGLYV